MIESKKLQELLAGVLGDFDPGKSLIDQGLDSFGAVRVQRGNANQFDVDVPLSEFLRDAPAAELVDTVSRTVGGAAPSPESPARAEAAPGPVDRDSSPLTPVQATYWVGRHGDYPLGGISTRFYLEFDLLHDGDRTAFVGHLEEARNRMVDAEFARRYLQSLQAFADGDVDASSVTADRPAASVARALDASGLSAGEVERRLSVFTRHLAGLAELSAPTLSGVPALLVEVGERSPANSGVGMGVDDAVGVEKLGWGDALPAATEVATVAAHHYSLLNDPALRDVVRLVGGFLARIGDELDAGREEVARPAGDERLGAEHGSGGRPTPAESRTKESVDGGE